MTSLQYFKDKVGKALFIRTVTYHYVGLVTGVIETASGELEAIQITKACWIYDTDDFAESMKKKAFKKVERYLPTQEVNVMKAAIVDWIDWDAGTLPL